jgi:sugar phosphate isomerase/epimerase
MHLIGLSSLYVTLFDHPLESFLGDLHYHNMPIGEVVNFKSTTLNDTNIAALKKANGNGIKLTVHSPLDIPSNISSSDAEARKTAIRKLKQAIDDAADIGAVAFVQHPGLKTSDVENGWELNCDSLVTLIDYGNSRNVKVLVENMAPWKSYMSTPEEFLEFAKTYRVNLHVAFDTGHAHIAKNSDEFLEKLAQYFFMVHITDNDGKNDSHLNIGEGSILWEKLVSGLQKQNFMGIYIVEAARDPLKSIDALKVLLR